MAKKNGTARGIYERVKGSGDWWIRYVDQDGKLHREKAWTKALAIDLYRKRKTEIREGKFFPDKIGRQRTTLFSELVRDFLEYSETNKRSHDTDKRKAAVLLTAFGRRPATAITALDVEQLKARLKKGRAPATVNRYLALLRSIFYYAVNITEKTGHNPVKKIKFFKEANERVRYLTDDEENRLFEALLTRHHALVEVALLTGLRASSLFGLDWANIDLAAGVYTVPHSKTGETLHLEMHSRVREILGNLPRNGSPYVFPGAKVGKPRRGISYSFRKAVRQAKIVNFHFHDLRHTWASRLAMAGVPLFTIMELGGWKTLKNVQRYAHLSPGHRREALARLTPRPTDTPDTPTDISDKSPNVERSGETGNDAKSLSPEGGVDPA